jgi:Aspartyl protease
MIAGGAAGVLGQDVLAGLTYTIDYRRRHIVWDDPRARDGRDAIAVLPLAFHDGLPIVELPFGDATLRLVADSGAGGLVLFDGGGRVLPGVTPDGGTVRVDTFHGTGIARSARIERFRVGASTFRGLAAVLMRRTSAPAHQGDGLLPLHLFDRVTFDGPGGRLIVG